MENYRILERIYDDHSEFYPQLLIKSVTYEPNLLYKLFGHKRKVYPEYWSMLLYKGYKNTKQEAIDVINAEKKTYNEIYHYLK
jgi:hypothetical protein